MVGILRFLEHAPIELQPGELAIDETVGIASEPASRRRRFAMTNSVSNRLSVRSWLGSIPSAAMAVNGAAFGPIYLLAGFCDSLISHLANSPVMLQTLGAE